MHQGWAGTISRPYAISKTLREFVLGKGKSSSYVVYNYYKICRASPRHVVTINFV